MSEKQVEVTVTDEFKRQMKKLVKKYASALSDYNQLVQSLKMNPFQGDDLGNGKRKVRMAITSKGKGKSGGARVITYELQQNSVNEIFLILLTIYDKGDIESLSDSYIDWLIQEYT